MNPEYFYITENGNAVGPFETENAAQHASKESAVYYGPVKIARVISVSNTVVTHTTTWNRPYPVHMHELGDE